MGRFSVILIIIIMTTFNISCTKKQEIRIQCEFFNFFIDPKIKFPREYLLNPNNNAAFDVGNSEPYKGHLTIENDVYILIFPKKEPGDYGVMGSFVKINRISGVSTLEQGRPPFDKNLPNNDIMRGICKKIRIESL